MRSQRKLLAVGLLLIGLTIMLTGLGPAPQPASAAGREASTAAWQPPTPLPWVVVPTPQPVLRGQAEPVMLSPTPYAGPASLAPTVSNPLYWLVLVLAAAGGLTLMSGFPEKD